MLETYSEIFKFVLMSSLKGSHKKYDETKYGRFCVLQTHKLLNTMYVVDHNVTYG